MIIDGHNHILAAGTYPDFEGFIKDMTRTYLQSIDELPIDREVSSEDWRQHEHLWAPVDPQRLIADHDEAGVDRSVVLAVAPSNYTKYGVRGTVDWDRVTDVEGPLDIARCNDYVAAVERMYPDKLMAIAAVNPRFRGIDSAVREFERAVVDLGMHGLKLYPMYDHWAINDRDLAFPLFAKASELGVPIMVHLASTPVADTVLDFGRPGGIDEVARRFSEVRMLICHAGHPWTDDALVIASRHPNVYLDDSFFNSTVTARQLYEFLMRARALGCPWSRICWATDYPGFRSPKELLRQLLLVNDVVKNGERSIDSADLARFAGGNFARFLGIDWDLDAAVKKVEALQAAWRH